MSQPTNDIFDHNTEALDHASTLAGEYLAEIGKSDLATFTGDQWREFLKVIVKGFDAKAVPF